nr:MAG: replication associated protein [Arizlama virus]
MRSRSYCFTLNNYSQEEYEALQNTEAKYIILGKEKGESNTPHIQGYIYFTTVKSLDQLKKLQPRAHWEIAKGNAEQNRTYCSKDGDFWEKGTPPLTSKQKGEANAERWESAKRAAIEGRLDDVPDDIYIKYYRTIKEIKKDNMPHIPDHPDVTGEWYWGEAGSGKSRTAREKHPNSYLKMCNKWWDGYQNEPTVIIDDVDVNHKVLGHHLKIWGDRYAFLAETKGGALRIRPQKIIVTSQYSIDQIWEDEETRAAIKRRFKQTHFTLLN